MRSLVLIVALLSFFQCPTAQEISFQAGHSYGLLEVKFSPDKSKLISYSYDGRICFWDVTTGRLLWRHETSFVQKGNEYYTLTTFSFSPDQNLIASGSGNGTIQLWDATSGRILWRADVFKDSVTTIEFSPDGKTILTAASQNDGQDEIKMVSVDDGKIIRKFDGKPCTVIAMSFEDNGKLLRTGSLDGNVSEWSVETGKQNKTPNVTPCRIRRTYEWETSFTRDLKTSASRTGDKELSLRDTATDNVTRKIEAGGYRVYSRLSADGKNLIVTTDDGFAFYDFATGEIRAIPNAFTTSSTIDLSVDGSLFAEGGSLGDAAIRITNTKTGQSRFLDGHPSVVKTIAYSPDGNYLAIAGSDKQIYVFDQAKRTLSKTLVGHMKPITSLAFSPDGKTLLSSSEDELMKVWNWKTGEFLKDIKSEENIFGDQKVSFSLDGKYVLTTSNQVQFSLWDASAWKLVRSFKTKEGYESKGGSMTIGYSGVPVTGGVFSNDASKIFTSHVDGTLRTWDINQGAQINKIKVGEALPFFQLSPDEKTIVAATEKNNQIHIKLIDTKSGRLITNFDDKKTSYIEALSISPDVRHFATSDNSGDVLLWDIKQLKPIRELDIGFSGDDAIAFSPDGKTLAVGGENQNLFLFDVETGNKLWQLIPSYQPSDLEIRLTEEKRVRQEALASVAAQRDKQAAIDTELYMSKVYITFEHYGDMTDPGEQRMMETSEPKKSKVKKSADVANAFWLRLHNDSPLPISIPTQSMYLPDRKCFFEFSNGEKLFGLCGDREISIWFGLENKDGKQLRYGYDFGSSAILLPNSSVLFAVPRTILKDKNAIVFSYNFQKETTEDKIGDYGVKRVLRFREADVSGTSR